MITPVGKKYHYPKRNKVVKVLDYEQTSLGDMIVIVYKNEKNGEVGRIPLDMFRKRFIRFNQYTQQKQKLKI